MNKTLTIDLRWLLLPFTMLFSLVSGAVQLSLKAIFGLFLLSGIGYLVVKAAKGFGYEYSASKPLWNFDCLQMKVTKRPRWATAYMGGRRRRYTVVGGPQEFYLKRSGAKAERQELMRGFYTRFLHERPSLPPQPIIVNAPLQTVPVPAPAPQPHYAPRPQFIPTQPQFVPYTPTFQGGTITYGGTGRRF